MTSRRIKLKSKRTYLNSLAPFPNHHQVHWRHHQHFFLLRLSTLLREWCLYFSYRLWTLMFFDYNNYLKLESLSDYLNIRIIIIIWLYSGLFYNSLLYHIYKMSRLLYQNLTYWSDGKCQECEVLSVSVFLNFGLLKKCRVSAAR